MSPYPPCSMRELIKRNTFNHRFHTPPVGVEGYKFKLFPCRFLQKKMRKEGMHGREKGKEHGIFHIWPSWLFRRSLVGYGRTGQNTLVDPASISLTHPTYRRSFGLPFVAFPLSENSCEKKGERKGKERKGT